jgi:methionyl-tRNA synthetase
MSQSPSQNRQFGRRPVFVFSSPTTPNGDLHLGHLGGPYLGADVYVRFQKLNGTKAFHIAGSDDFQSYVAGAARRDGRTPAETAAHYSAEILATHRLMDIEIDEYTVSGADPSYPGRVQQFFSRVAAGDQVTVTEDDALFGAEDGRYLYEVEVSGGCPSCGSGTGGNMCEECGEPNFCADLRDPQQNGSGTIPRRGRISRYSLALHELLPDIQAHHRLGRVPARVKELAHRLRGRPALDIAISHPGQWGVPPVEDGVDGQVIWVWIDMAYRFLHGIESIGRKRGEAWSAEKPQQDWKIVHFLGFDNTFYHAVFVPAMYRLAYPDWQPDIDYNLNEFSLLEGSKFSTSRRHAIWGKDVLNPGSVDGLRCYLSWMRPEGRRTNFVLAEYQDFVENILIGQWQSWLTGLGSRIEADHGGQAPHAAEQTPEQAAFVARLEDRLAAVTNSLAQDGFSLNRAVRELDGIVGDARAFAGSQALISQLPGWQAEAATSIALELAAARLLGGVSAPVMPRFAGRLATALGLEGVEPIPAGTTIELAGQTFFADPFGQPGRSDDESEDSAEVQLAGVAGQA